jgi:PAS domain S-box-containing protein
MSARGRVATPTSHARRRLIVIGLVVAVIYVIAAKMGFRLAFVAEQVTTVWAPTGIAEAALLLWGRALWPAIWMAALVANASIGVPFWAAAGIATGNTLEAIAAAWLLRRISGFDPKLQRIPDVVAFIVFGALVSTAISASVGVMSLCSAGLQPWTRVKELWSDWWLGDALGALVFAPIILTTVRATAAQLRRRWPETLLFVTGAAAAAQLVFGPTLSLNIGQHPLEYIVFWFVIVAAVRLGQPPAALVVLAASIVTIWNTVRGGGPFAGPSVHESLFLLQTFMGVLAATGLLLAAAIAERTTSERRRAAAFTVGEVLTEAHNLPLAAPAILRAICQNLDWQVGTLWLVDHAAQRLHCLSVWTVDEIRAAGFVAASKDTHFPSGVGLPGRVWLSGKPAWIEDVLLDQNFPRAPFARQAGVHGAFAFPVCVDDEVFGVIEFFTDGVAAPDADLLQTMSTVGNQVGDFVARKRGEAALLEGQRRTAAILDSALDAIVGMAHSGTITDFNPAAERMFGHARQEAVGRELAELLVPQRLRDSHRDGLVRHLTVGAGAFIDRRIETTALHSSGREFPVEISITRVAGVEPPRFTGFVRDLTARVQAERERELLLERELFARREAEAANRAKDEFLATLSHELRTPLNAIVGWTRMLLDNTLDERSRRRALEVIDRNAHLQVKLVADILDVSRIITGGLRLDVRPVDLHAVIGTALDSVRPAAEAKKIRIHSGLAVSVPLLEGDPQRLQQIVWNLLANAVKFTPPEGEIHVELLDNGNGSVRIRIADNGAGIDPEFLPHAFERFRQADGSVSRQYGGLGLGLAIVRHLVELHGGVVRAESSGLGRGSAFTVELPFRSRTATLPGHADNAS